MANISVTYSFTNGTTADATEVNQNFTDIINGTSDGTKDLSVSAITAAGTLTANGAVNLGNATSDDITVTGRFASDLDPKTAASNTLGDATQTWQALYLDNTATDGGAIYFDGGSTEYLKSTADGVSLEVGGFGSIKIPDGTVSLPSIWSSTGTSDTGMYMDTADEIDFSCAGSDVLNISASGLTFALGGAALGAFAHGAHNPTIADRTNCSGGSATGSYTRIGNLVVFYGNIDITVTSSGVNTVFSMTVPVARSTNFALGDVAGICTTMDGGATTTLGARTIGSNTGKIQFQSDSSGSGLDAFSYFVIYRLD